MLYKYQNLSVRIGLYTGSQLAPMKNENSGHVSHVQEVGEKGTCHTFFSKVGLCFAKMGGHICSKSVKTE